MRTDDTLRLFHLPFSFMLPQRVASEKGYFADEGLDVELIERDRTTVDRKYIPGEESLTTDYEVDMYPICKWESLKRTWDMGDGKIIANGTFADQPYSVFVRADSNVSTPEDLAGVPVGVNRRTGQEYTAIRALEAHIDPAEVQLRHCGMPTDRLRALRDGEVEAITLIEPQSTLAEHLGFRRLMTFDNHMGIVGGERIDPEALEQFMNAYERAVADINADPEAYRDAYLDMLETEAGAGVAPDLFADVDMDALRETITVPTYDVPEIADSEDLEGQLDWMKRRQLIDDDADIDAIVAPVR